MSLFLPQQNLRHYRKHIQYRHLNNLSPDYDQNTIVLITGEHQTGKKTIAKIKYPNLTHINLYTIENREKIKSIPTSPWSTTIGTSILD